MQAAMAKKKRHSRAEIATKLAEANELATQGKLQREIAHTLGVSVMTLHRWHKVPAVPQPASVVIPDGKEADRADEDRIAQLLLENSRLRRLITDLLLERIKREEAVQSQRAVALREESSQRAAASPDRAGKLTESTGARGRSTLFALP